MIFSLYNLYLQFLNPHFALRMKTKIQDGSSFIKETRYLVTGSSASVKAKFKSYISDNWNRVDVLTIVLFLTALILRFLPYHSTFDAARVVYAVNFITFFFRILHIFSVHRELGPKLVMIGNMLYDLSYFMVILMVFVGSYAIASYSILYPNTEVTGDIVLRVLRMSYWNLYGELFMDEIELEEPDCTFDKTLITNSLPQCPTKVGRYATPILMGIYVLFANILLLNLLIAMFSYTIQKIQDRTDQHWNFQRYILIYEYYSKPPLPPPLILISHVFLLIRACIRKCCSCCGCCQSDQQSDLIKRFPNERELVQWENVIADSYQQRLEERELDLVDKKVQLTHERLDKLLARMDQAHETHMTPQVTPSYKVEPIVKMPPQLDKRLRTLEDQMLALGESVQWIVKSLQKGKQSVDVPAPTELSRRKEEEMKYLQQKKIQDSMYLQQMVSQQAESQTKSRNVNYPGTSIKKFAVPDDKASWSVSWPQYKPIYYESPLVKKHPYWADHINLLDLKPEAREGKLKFNAYDDLCRYNRVSNLGKYKVIDGVPQNPICRTGMVGRGLLGRWGPNHAGDPIVTRWKRDNNGQKMEKNGKYQFEFIAIIRTDNKLNSLPGGMVEPGQNVYECLKAEFKEEALGSLMQDENHKSKIRDRLKIMFEEGQLIYQGYADDPRNTDNAWIETNVYHYHDDTGEVLYPFEIRQGGLRAGETVDAVSWRTASASLTLHAAHAYYVKKVADKLDAAF